MELAHIIELLRYANEHGVRLWADNGQLRYRAVQDAATDSVLAKFKDHRAELIDALSGPSYERRAAEGRGPILDFYQTYWMRIRSGAIHAAVLNTTHSVVRFSGHIDVDVLRGSFDVIAAKHAILRARVEAGTDGFHFVFDRPVPLTVEDLSATDPAEREAVALRTAEELVWRPFDVDAEPLFRPFLIKLSATESIIGFVVHHFICDRTSVLVMSRELARNYAGLGFSLPTSSAPLQYTDYVTGMNDWLQGMNAKLRLQYWRGQLKGACATRIQPDYDPDPTVIGAVNIERFHVAAAVVQALNGLAVSKRVTHFVIVLAAKMAVLSHLLDSSDVTVLSMHDGRDDQRLDGMVGATMRRLAIRCAVPMHASFQDS